MSYVSYGNDTLATRKKVRFYNRESSAETLYEGQPLCYIFDSTTNEMGINKQTGAEGSTTAESYHNEGKLVQVEKPNDDNLLYPAGVVASGSWCGKSIAATSWVDIDVFIPNGAVVLVRADVECTVGVTVLALESDSQALTQPLSANQGRPVAIAMETNTALDSTPGLILARLCPNEFIYQDQTGTALSVAVAGTSDIVVNKIRLTTAQTSGNFCALSVESTSSAGAASNGYGASLYVQGDLTGTPSSHWNPFGCWANVTGGTPTHIITVGEFGLYVDGATMSSVGKVSVLTLRYQFVDDAAANGNLSIFRIVDDSSYDPCDALISAYNSTSIKLAAQSNAAVSHTIPIIVERTAGGIAAGTYYIMVSDAA